MSNHPVYINSSIHKTLQVALEICQDAFTEYYFPVRLAAFILEYAFHILKRTAKRYKKLDEYINCRSCHHSLI